MFENVLVPTDGGECAGTTILEYIADEGIDLVVMDTHGRSGVERYLPGSVTERTVWTSPEPVLTVRRPTGGR